MRTSRGNYYPEELIEEVRMSNDIVDVISQYIHIQKKGNNYVGLCPFHNEKTGSFSVSPSKQMFYCFGCGTGGNVITFLMKYDNMTFPEAVKLLAQRANITLPEHEMTQEEKKRADKKTQIMEVNKEAATYFYKLLRSTHGTTAMTYFTKRELSLETINQFGLGYADKYSDDLYRYLKKKGYQDDLLRDAGLVSYDEVHGGRDRFWNRVMFPIMDVNGKVIAFGGRVLGDGLPKYVNSPETEVFDKSRTMYGLYLARKSKRPNMILCEGYMDVIALHQAGFDNAAASLGTAFTLGHANLIKRYVKEVYLSYDSDGAGVKAAIRAIPILRQAGISARVINMKPYKDPDEFMKNLGEVEYEKRMDEAEDGITFIIHQIETKYHINDPASKVAFLHEAEQELLLLTEGMERNIYLEAMSFEYHVQLEDLQNDLIKLAGKNIIKHSDEEVLNENRPREIQTQAVKQGDRHNAKTMAENGIRHSQRLLLTWLIEKPEIFSTVLEYISIEDFEEGVYREAAELLFEQLRNKEPVNPAKIISCFEDVDEQTAVGEIFNTTVGELTQQSAKGKAFKETLVKIKQKRVHDLSTGENAFKPGNFELLKQERLLLETIMKQEFNMN